jgi:TonB-linked SusC/RagA family outer membrane protein
MNKILKTLLTSFCVLVTTVLMAQNITGVVHDETGAPLPGASVSVVGTTIGVTTNFEGKYSIQVDNGKSLQFSFIGKKNQIIEIGDKTVINVVLKGKDELIDEVVVMAYGVQRKKDITASVASVKADKMQDVPAGDVTQVLQGKLAGVRIAGSSGMPGMANTILIRGAGSVNAGNAPLVVIDGVPISSESDAAMYNGQELSPLMDINPTDIASVEVLKDASAAALYGSRASNGVILITTKAGTKGASKIVYDAYYGWGEIQNKVKFVNANQYLSLQNEARSNYNNDNGLTEGQNGYLAPFGDPNKPLANTNWLNEITRNYANSESHQVSITGGTEKTSVYLSLGYVMQEGIVKKNKYDRYSTRANITHEVNKWLNVGFNSSFSISENNRLMGDNNIYGSWSNAMTNRPDEPVYNEDGSYYLTSNSNPVQCYNEPEYTTKIYNGIGKSFANIKLFKELSLYTSLGGNYIHTKDHIYEPATSLQGAGTNGNGRAINNTRGSIITESMLKYKKQHEKLSIDALLGYSFQRDTKERAYVTGENFPSPSLPYLSSAAVISGGSSSWTQYAIESYFGRANLNYDDKYLMSVSFRRDGSSKFSEDNKWGYFPAASLGWIVSNESFFSENNIINFLKLRTSYGVTGNQEGIGNFASRVLIQSGSDYNGSPGISPQGSSVGNKDLTWEKNKQFNIGMDLNLLNNRIEVFAEYYNNVTEDLLITKGVGATGGYTSIYDNVGSIRNKGFEFSVTSKNIVGDFHWETTFNLATLKNEVLELHKGEAFPAGFSARVEEGHPFASFYMIKALGVYQNESEIPQLLKDAGVRPGDVKYEDLDGNGMITDDDRQFVGTPYPTLYGGIGNSMKWKNFDLNLFCEFSTGNEIYAMWRQGDGAGNLGYSTNTTSLKEYNSRWVGEGTSNSTPRAIVGKQGVYNTQVSTRFLEDASYFRFKTLTIGYTLPEHILLKIPVNKVRIYATAQNLYNITNYSGFDPEVNSFHRGGVRNSGNDIASTPQLRTFMLGANITF